MHLDILNLIRNKSLGFWSKNTKRNHKKLLTCIFGILYVMYQKKVVLNPQDSEEDKKINHSGFHGNAANLDILNLISVGAQNGSSAFRVLVGTLTFSFWNQFLIGSEIINVIIGLDDCQINGRTRAHVIDNTSCNGITNQFFGFLFLQIFLPIFFKNSHGSQTTRSHGSIGNFGCRPMGMNSKQMGS